VRRKGFSRKAMSRQLAVQYAVRPRRPELTLDSVFDPSVAVPELRLRDSQIVYSEGASGEMYAEVLNPIPSTPFIFVFFVSLDRDDRGIDGGFGYAAVVHCRVPRNVAHGVASWT